MNEERTDEVWIEKYRPAKLSEIAGNAGAKREMLEWAKTWSGPRAPRIRAMILAGPPGVGKTTSALALASEMNWDLIEMNASDKRGEREIRRIVVPGSRTNTFSVEGDYYSIEEKRRHVIILDEADNLHGNEDKGGMLAISEMIKETEQPVILIVNDLDDLRRRSSSLKRNCRTVNFVAPDESEIVAVLRRIAESEHLSVDAGTLYEVAKKARGDVRAAINNLQGISSPGENVDRKNTEMLVIRNRLLMGKEGVEHMLASRDFEHSRKLMFEMKDDPDRILLWLDEKFPLYRPDMGSLERGFQMLSYASLMLSRARTETYFRFWSYAYDVMALSATAAGPERSYSDGRDWNFPYILARMSRRSSLLRIRSSTAAKISVHCHTSRQNAINTVLPFLSRTFSLSETFAINMARKLSLTPEEVAEILGVKEDDEMVSKIFKNI